MTIRSVERAPNDTSSRLVFDPAVAPAVRVFLEYVREHNLSIKQIANRSGVHDKCLRSWKRRRSPGLNNFVAALNTVGLDIAVVDMETREEIACVQPTKSEAA